MAYSKTRSRRPSGWDDVAAWYAGLVGPQGSRNHRGAILPAVLELLAPRPREHVLDVGCGPGVLAPHLHAAGARLTGIDASERLIKVARQRHGRLGRFLVGDAAALDTNPVLAASAFDAATFVMSIQDMAPLDAVLRSAGTLLGPHARIVMVMSHPCFRVPRQSGWGHDPDRQLQYRRIDRYLTPLAVPMPNRSMKGKATRSHHRPLGDYVNELAANGFRIEVLREIALPEGRAATRAEQGAFREIPMFLALRAVRC